MPQYMPKKCSFSFIVCSKSCSPFFNQVLAHCIPYLFTLFLWAFSKITFLQLQVLLFLVTSPISICPTWMFNLISSFLKIFIYLADFKIFYIFQHPINLLSFFSTFLYHSILHSPVHFPSYCLKSMSFLAVLLSFYQVAPILTAGGRESLLCHSFYMTIPFSLFVFYEVYDWILDIHLFLIYCFLFWLFWKYSLSASKKSISVESNLDIVLDFNS